MTHDAPKKRLKLLPEVLPAPPATSELSPRQRTLNTLGRLVAVATAAAVMTGCKDKGSGYGVVDPIVPPARCTGLAETVRADVTWKTGTTLLLKLSKPGLVGSHYVNQSPRVSGATLVSSNIASDSAEIEIEVPPGAAQIMVWIGVECSAGPQLLMAVVSFDADAGASDAQRSVTVQLTDQPG